LFAQERNAQKTLFLAWSQAKGKMNRSAMDGRVSRFLPKGALVTGPDVLHRSFAYFLQDIQVEVAQLLEVNTGFAHPELTQVVEQLIVLIGGNIDVERKFSLPGRETENGRIALVAAGVLVMIFPKSNN